MIHLWAMYFHRSPRCGRGPNHPAQPIQTFVSEFPGPGQCGYHLPQSRSHTHASGANQVTHYSEQKCVPPSKFVVSNWKTKERTNIGRVEIQRKQRRTGYRVLTTNPAM